MSSLGEILPFHPPRVALSKCQSDKRLKQNSLEAPPLCQTPTRWGLVLPGLLQPHFRAEAASVKGSFQPGSIRVGIGLSGPQVSCEPEAEDSLGAPLLCFSWPGWQQSGRRPWGGNWRGQPQAGRQKEHSLRTPLELIFKHCGRTVGSGKPQPPTSQRWGPAWGGRLHWQWQGGWGHAGVAGRLEDERWGGGGGRKKSY